MANTIEVLDALMGLGKTNGIFEWMNKNPQHKYLYVTPLLSEAEERACWQCAEIDMQSTKSEDSLNKGEILLKHFQQGNNVAITHALYSRMNHLHLEEIHNKGYVLIIDEEVSFIQAITKYNEADSKFLTEQCNALAFDQNDFGRVSFIKEAYTGSKYEDLQNLCEIGAVFSAKDRADLLITQLPVDLVKAASRVIVITYGYEGSMMCKFMELRGINHKAFEEVSFSISEKDQKENIRQLIELVDTKTTLALKKNTRKNTLSSTWWSTASTTDKKKILSLIAGVKRQFNCSSEDFMFTCKKSCATTIKHNNLSPSISFVYASCRATNDYSNKYVLVHAYNRYVQYHTQQYLASWGFTVDNDKFALYEMLQWIWRSRIRQNKPIKLCILSARMEKILKDWLVL